MNERKKIYIKSCYSIGDDHGIHRYERSLIKETESIVSWWRKPLRDLYTKYTITQNSNIQQEKQVISRNRIGLLIARWVFQWSGNRLIYQFINSICLRICFNRDFDLICDVVTSFLGGLTFDSFKHFVHFYLVDFSRSFLVSIVVNCWTNPFDYSV